METGNFKRIGLTKAINFLKKLSNKLTLINILNNLHMPICNSCEKQFDVEKEPGALMFGHPSTLKKPFQCGKRTYVRNVNVK